MKILTVVGARPQFIKAAAVSRILREQATEILVHTGQHHDYNMSEVFFEELGIPKPDYNLGVSGGSHAQMTGEMMMSMEEVMLAEKPDVILLYGDTNSTLAGAITAAKLHIPICHVEAGNRLGSMTNPEEINRICTDHVSTRLLPCTQSAMSFLEKEGLAGRARIVGDPMYDAFLYYGGKITDKDLGNIVGKDGNLMALPREFYYLTCHREENTATDEQLTEVLKAMDSLDAPTIYPVHPRNRERAIRICQSGELDNVILTQPIGYLSSIALVKRAKKIVTDSGGLQREAFFAEKQCVFVFDKVLWPETMVGNRNQLADPVAGDILSKLAAVQTIDRSYKPFGDGHAGRGIVSELLKM